jgi:hypothetical protein
VQRAGGRGLTRIALSVAIVAAVSAVIVARHSECPGFRGKLALIDSAVASGSDHMDLPQVMLWAWESPQDLRFLNPRTTGVAFLAGTVEIDSDGDPSELGHGRSVVMHPRLQPLLVPPGTALMAVIRVETSNDLWHESKKPRDRSSTNAQLVYSVAQEVRTASLIASAAGIPGVRAMQVDYDAVKSEQPFYERVLRDLRKQLPQGMPLSVTALASWCMSDRWLDRLPPKTIEEAVPMLFRMGPGADEVSTYLRAGSQFPECVCQSSLGVSTDEAFSRSVLNGSIAKDEGRRPVRVYVFSGQPWTAEMVNKIVGGVETWDSGAHISH